MANTGVFALDAVQGLARLSGRVAADSGGGLSSKIGEHSYVCPFGGPCDGSGFLGSELNVDTIVMTIVTMALLIALALVVRSRLSVERPRGVQNVMEFAFEFVNGLVADSLGAARTRSIGPLAVALFLFILVSNLLGLLPIPYSWWHSPTSDINTPAALAIFVVILMHVLGARKHKGGYVRHVFEYPALAPITLIEELARPLTLAARLFGNIFAGEVLILVFGTLLFNFMYVLLPVAHGLTLLLDLFVDLIQAFIFTVLTIAYIGISTSGETEHH